MGRVIIKGMHVHTHALPHGLEKSSVGVMGIQWQLLERANEPSDGRFGGEYPIRWSRSILIGLSEQGATLALG